MRRVLITGGSGFIGRHVTAELLRRKYSVRILDALIEQVHGEGHVPLPDGVQFLQGDIRDPVIVEQALKGMDAVIHLAAEVGVGQSMYEIARYVAVNDLGTAVLLECLLRKPVDRIVLASSMSVYGEGAYAARDGRRVDDARRDPRRLEPGHWDPLSGLGEPLIPIATDESKPSNLASIYALTKYAQERAVMIFGQAYGVDAVALRLFNVFGPGQALSNPYTGVLANFAARLTNGERPIVFEDGRQRRDFVHVQDVARAFALALEKQAAAGHVINIGSGLSHAIADVAALLAGAMGAPEIEPEILDKARAGDIRHCFADIGKARDLLGYEPQHDLAGSMAEIAAWAGSSAATDRGAEMKSQLETMGLIT